jgi:hypothetical protein
VVDEESGRSDALELGRRVGNLKGEEDASAVEAFGTRWPRRMVRGHEGDPVLALLRRGQIDEPRGLEDDPESEPAYLEVAALDQLVRHDDRV